MSVLSKFLHSHGHRLLSVASSLENDVLAFLPPAEAAAVRDAVSAIRSVASTVSNIHVTDVSHAAQSAAAAIAPSILAEAAQLGAEAIASHLAHAPAAAVVETVAVQEAPASGVFPPPVGGTLQDGGLVQPIAVDPNKN